MTLDEIFSLWKEDSEIDISNVDHEAVKIPKLHHKYYRLFSNENLSLKKLETDYKILFRDKFEYFMGTLDKETLEQRGWKPNQRNLLKSDIPMNIESDEEIIKQTLRIALQKEKIKALESIIKMIIDRGYSLKTIIDWQRFKSGG